jgi:hypothetical protein
MDSGGSPVKSEAGNQKTKTEKEAVPAELISLFFILLKERAKEHKCKTCPACIEYGITQI